MPYYLQMDGVDDLLRSPQVTVTRIVIDFMYEANAAISTNGYYLFDNRGGTPSGNYMVSVGTSNVIVKQNGWTTLKVNGVTVTTNVAVTPGTRIVVDAEGVAVTSDANGIEFAVNYINQNITRFKGNIYRITGYNGASVVFDYDMNTGTLQDQSGNGRHGTLTGGTWISDAPIGIDVIYSYTMKQSTYALRSSVSSMVQVIVSNRLLMVSLQQSLTANQLSTYLLTQQIISIRSRWAAMQQSIVADRSATSLTEQKISSQSINSVAIQLAISRVLEWSFPLLIKFIDPHYSEVIILAVTPISGQRFLTAPVTGQRIVTVPIEGRVGMATKQNLTMRQGESRVHPLTLLDQDGSPLQLDGCEVIIKVHQRYKASSTDLVKIAEIIDPFAGSAFFEFLPLDTLGRSRGVYELVIWVKDSAGHESPVTEGELTIY